MTKLTEQQINPDSKTTRVWKLSADNSWDQQVDHVAVEAPLQIQINGAPWLTTMRTPGHDQELALGLLLAEGIISSPADVVTYTHSDKNNNLLRITLAAHCQFDPEALERTVVANSSCGICGKTNIDTLGSRFSPVANGKKISTAMLTRLPDQLLAAQSGFQQTGGLHAAALFDLHGNLKIIREDVGRHNAVDKVVGYALLKEWLPLHDTALLVSGRIAFEIIHKALAAGLPLIAGISAPTTLAVSLAEANNQTLIGFLRNQQMNVYSHKQRLRDPGS